MKLKTIKQINRIENKEGISDKTIYYQKALEGVLEVIDKRIKKLKERIKAVYSDIPNSHFQEIIDEFEKELKARINGK